ncbi:MAG: hypothetical protein KAR30_08970, partial [Gammaproteobacteria bacterium]|nr:hypothetical protein [Gammaproteobacteria bacterium]
NMSTKNNYREWLLVVGLLLLTGCSINQLTVRASLPLVEGGLVALQSEPDLMLAEAAFAPNIELLEGMIVNDPGNTVLRSYMIQAYNGYAFSFVEDNDRERASRFYYRGVKHGFAAFKHQGLDLEKLTVDEIQSAVADKGLDSVPLMFWMASCWAKWIDLSRDNPVAIAQLSKASTLMDRVIELDESYFYGGPHWFFGVFYGGRAPMFGGDFDKAKQHFDKGREITQNKLLIIDLLQAQFLARQMLDQRMFHDKLTAIIDAPDGLFPEVELLNRVAKKKAGILLKLENEWF